VTPNAVLLFQRDLYRRRVRPGIARVVRRETGLHAVVGVDKIQNERLDDLPNSCRELPETGVGAFDGRAGLPLAVNDHLTGVRGWKKGDGEQRIQHQAGEKENGYASNDEGR